MGSRYEVEITIVSAKDLKNVNWRHGPVKPYAVVWVDPRAKCSTKVDDVGDTSPYWNETLVIPFDSPIEDSSTTLYIDIVHANAAEDTEPLIGSARLQLCDIADEAGLGRRVDRKVDLKRPSGRPHGRLEVQATVREPRHRAPEPYYAPPYGVPPSRSRDNYPAPPPPQSYGYPYGAPPPTSAYPGPPTGYPYGAAEPAYEEKKKSKFGGMGAGLAVGAVAGVVGGVALAEGAEYLEDKIAEDAAEKVEDDLGYDEGGDDW